MQQEKFSLKKFLFYVVVTQLIGFIGGMLGGDASAVYAPLVKPPLSPPALTFPIVWGILYLILGIAAYMIDREGDNVGSLRFYWVQIVLNALWSLFFFRLKWFTFAAIWIVLLILLTARLFLQFNKIKKCAALLLIPYLLWLFFALYLNIGFAMLN